MAKRVGVDKWIFFTTLLLVVVGLAMVFSASAIIAQEHFHTPYALLSPPGRWASGWRPAHGRPHEVDYTRYNSPRFIFPALAVTTVLLVIVFFFRNAQHAHRWILFGGLLLPALRNRETGPHSFSGMVPAQRLDAISDWRHTLLRAAIMPVVFILLIVKQPDLGTALVLAGVTAMMLVLAGMEWKYLALGVRCRAAAPGRPALLGSLASPAHARLSASGLGPAGRRLPHQSVAHRRRHRWPHRPRIHGGHAEALLPARSFHRLHLRQRRRGTGIHWGHRHRRPLPRPRLTGGFVPRTDHRIHSPASPPSASRLPSSCRPSSISASSSRSCPPRESRCRSSPRAEPPSSLPLPPSESCSISRKRSTDRLPKPALVTKGDRPMFRSAPILGKIGSNPPYIKGYP